MFLDRMQDYFLSITGGRPEQPTGRCICCGACCKAFGWHLTTTGEDLARWKQEGRNDLLLLVNKRGWIWCDPKTGRNLDPCPFLTSDGPERMICSIDQTKPAICREYPGLSHGFQCAGGRVHL